MHTRKTHCPNGHPYSDQNLYTSPRGYRYCLECRRRHGREHMREKRLSPEYREKARAKDRAMYAAKSEEWYQAKLAYNRKRKSALRHSLNNKLAAEISPPDSDN